ncbi:MAG: chemotaxis-specific protein-glutamate methyltransferase CheB [Candidatus Riflebacteria bacterium]|nr:chemotaxis-specific protein-glutamate methyltransferase CheB [Candidatus Riflebacteria bacterium]
MRIILAQQTSGKVEILRRILTEGLQHEVVGEAYSGGEILEKCRVYKPDALLMDVMFSDLPVAAVLTEVMRNSPCAILIVTSSVDLSASKVLSALGAGALDAVNAPVEGTDNSMEFNEKFLKKFRLLERLSGTFSQREKPLNKIVSCANPDSIVAIGASTGGPGAIAAVLNQFPTNPGFVTVVIQHLEERFCEGMTAWLNQMTHQTVIKAENGDSPKQGIVYFACTNDHLRLTEDGTFRYSSKPEDNPFRPSVDVFFTSLAEHWAVPGVAVLLTGMGNDGAAGMLALKNKNWHTIAQDETTSAVFGMPRAAIKIGAALQVLALDAIADSILKQLQTRIER